MLTGLHTPERSAYEIISLYKYFGDNDYIGEPVSQLEHMVQAAMIAEEEGYEEELVLAAFFHDIGHFCDHAGDVAQMDGYGVVDHEKLGADYLRTHGISEKIASLVENHVQAKRYLTYRYPEYYANLSEASKQTLKFQGGVMSTEEAAVYEADPLFEMHIKLRRWDERAKVAHKPLPPIEKYHDMIVHHLKNKQHANQDGGL